MPALPPSKRYFPLLDALRGPAALLVFLEHWRNLFFLDFADLESPGIALRCFYALTGAGHEAVMVFFVLSGCVIAHVIHSMHLEGRWSWGGYVSARLTRLWVVLIPALLLTAGWDRAGMFLGGEIYGGGGFGNVLQSMVADSSTLPVFFGNIFFLQTILVPTFGSNGPLWSISYEFVYYLVYPLMIVAFTLGPKAWWHRVLAMLLAVGLLAFAGESIVGAFPIWLAGGAAYWLFRRFPLPERFTAKGFAFGLLALSCSILGSRGGPQLPLGDWVWLITLSCAFTAYCGLSAHPTEIMMRLLRPLHRLSAMSYSLYLLHMPALVFTASLLFSTDRDRWQPSTSNLPTALLIATVVFCYTALVWYFTENQTGKVRRLVVGLTHRRNAAG